MNDIHSSASKRCGHCEQTRLKRHLAGHQKLREAVGANRIVANDKHDVEMMNFALLIELPD